MTKKTTKKTTKKFSKWVNFGNSRTLKLKDKDISSGKVIIDFKNYRWRRKYK